MRRNRLGDDSAGRDHRIFADVHARKDDGAGSDHDATPQADISGNDRAWADGNVVSYVGVMADAGAAVDEHESSDLSGRTDIRRAVEIAPRSERGRRRDDRGRIDEGPRPGEAALTGVLGGLAPMERRKQRHRELERGQLGRDIFGPDDGLAGGLVGFALDVLDQRCDLQSEPRACLRDIRDHHRTDSVEDYRHAYSASSSASAIAPTRSRASWGWIGRLRSRSASRSVIGSETPDREKWGCRWTPHGLWMPVS